MYFIVKNTVRRGEDFIFTADIDSIQRDTAVEYIAGRIVIRYLKFGIFEKVDFSDAGTAGKRTCSDFQTVVGKRKGTDIFAAAAWTNPLPTDSISLLAIPV